MKLAFLALTMALSVLSYAQEVNIKATKSPHFEITAFYGATTGSVPYGVKKAGSWMVATNLDPIFKSKYGISFGTALHKNVTGGLIYHRGNITYWGDVYRPSMYGGNYRTQVNAAKALTDIGGYVRYHKRIRNFGIYGKAQGFFGVANQVFRGFASTESMDVIGFGGAIGVQKYLYKQLNLFVEAEYCKIREQTYLKSINTKSVYAGVGWKF